MHIVMYGIGDVNQSFSQNHRKQIKEENPEKALN
jgi:hypothetical protein